MEYLKLGLKVIKAIAGGDEENDEMRNFDLRIVMGKVRTHFVKIADELRVFNDELSEVQRILEQISDKAGDTGNKLKPFSGPSNKPPASNSNVPKSPKSPPETSSGSNSDIRKLENKDDKQLLSQPSYRTLSYARKRATQAYSSRNPTLDY